MIPNIVNEEDIDVVIQEIVNIKDFERSISEIETYGIIEELKFSQEYEDGGTFILYDLNKKNERSSCTSNV